MSGSRSEADSEIGRRIRTRRKSLGITQAELAQSLGISFQQLQKYEKGMNAVAERRLAQICDILKIQPSFFTNIDPMIGDSASSSATDLTHEVSIADFNAILSGKVLENSEIRRLIEAFISIADPRVRARIAQFVVGLAEDQKK